MSAPRLVTAPLKWVIRLPRGLTIAGLQRLLLVGLLFTGALGIRLENSSAPPLDFQATRQYRSLIIARAFYVDGSSSVPEWEKQVARVSQQRQGMLEPPIMELLAATGYRVLGGEQIWLPRLLSSVFWLIGCAFLYRIAVKVTDPTAALCATAFYLFLPFAVVASRSFQPDPLMVMLVLASVWTIVRFNEDPSNVRFTTAAILSAAAVFVKPGALFVVLACYIALGVSRKGLRRTFWSPRLPVFVGMTVVPALVAYGYWVLSGAFEVGQAEKTLLLQLWVSPFYWRGLLANIESTVGIVPFIGALLGTFLFRAGMPRALVIGLWIGYASFSLALNYNVATHDYYQLQLIPIAALCLGPILVTLLARVYETHSHWLGRAGAWGVLVMALLFAVVSARASLRDPGWESVVKVDEEIGAFVDHSTHTVILAGDYGVPLEYHGLLSGSAWPLAADLEWEQLAGLTRDNAATRFQRSYAPESPDYFIVTDLSEFDQQVDLKQFLGHFGMVARSDSYLIFDLRQSVTP